MNPGAWKAWVAAAAILLTGMALGSLVTLGVERRAAQQVFNTQTETERPWLADRLTGRLQRDLATELKLTPAQIVHTRRELLAAMIQFRQLRMSSSRQFQDIINNSLARIAVDLDPAQKAALDRLASERMQRLGLRYAPAAAR
jgi:hypothetical protein